jgi:hypothetical protein
LRQGQDTICAAVRRVWPARPAARLIPRRILSALAVLVSFSKLASVGQFEQIGTVKSSKIQIIYKQISGKHMPLPSWQRQQVAISSELSKMRQYLQHLQKKRQVHE